MTDRVGEFPSRRGGFGILLNAAGIAVVSAYLIAALAAGSIPLWSFVVGVVALLAWVAAVAVPPQWVTVTRILFLVMVVCAATVAWVTNGLLIVPVIAGVLWVCGAAEHPAWLGYLYGVIAAALIAIAPLAVAAGGGPAPTVESILSLEFAVLVAVLGGANRRQSRARNAAALQLAEQAAAMQQEQARASALEERQSLARDLHDVLAHSLGGLVIQLDAVEAQVENGQTDAALARLRDARGMAASGLAEARRAVEALRSVPDAAARLSPADLAASLIDLVDAHERLGGRIDFTQTGEPVEVAQHVATALRRALQESLSNARKHAPGEPVSVRIAWQGDSVVLEVVNRVPEPTPGSPHPGELAGTGAGHGLLGMRERFATLPGGRVEAGRVGDVFTVHAEAGLSPAPRAAATAPTADLADPAVSAARADPAVPASKEKP